ncbi:MAG TPA: TonB-dependent receptor [Kofleriaceae bacterium]|nr:TonB-dependent receptor [Kofleriaceae bacterium]
MNSKQLLIAFLGSASLFTASSLLEPSVARAQSSTTGGIQGVVTDGKTGDKLAGVTVIVTSPALAQTQTSITDENGAYSVTDIPPGDYLVTFYYADITVERSGIRVGVGKTTPVFQKINMAAAGGETIKVQDTAPTIDPTSTTQGITIDKNYLKNIPVPGRTFESALGAAAGSQNDGVGVSFSGSSSLENQYIVDGVNTTGLTLGTVGSPVINDFIEEIEVITGGYNAEYGRATGGVVNVVTKSGSNEFKGSVFGYWQPGVLTAAARTTPINAASIDVKRDLAYNADFGFELGGPIIKDKMWFYIGFAPAFAQVDSTRTTKRRTDCRKIADPMNGIPQGGIPGLSDCVAKGPDGIANGLDDYSDTEPDIDPKTGFYITDTLDSEVRSARSQIYNTLAKINYAATPEHQGQIALQAQPGTGRSPRIYGQAGMGTDTSQLVTDLSAKWTSKFNDNKTEVEGVVGWHREQYKVDAIDPTVEQTPYQELWLGNLSKWGPAFGETMATNTGCHDDPAGGTDPYPGITNCSMDSRPYIIGGPGFIDREVTQRRAAKLGVTQRVKAGGNHEIKGGIDVEDNLSNTPRLYSGGGYIVNFLPPTGSQTIIVDRYVQLAAPNETDPRFDNSCVAPDPTSATMQNKSYKCDYLSGVPGSPGTDVNGQTVNWAAYLRDSWQIRPNLTLNAGLRYEEQRLRFSENLRNKQDPLTLEQHGTNAMTLTGNISPRIGLLYDWTKEGRSKIYGHWGRFYESIPMDINTRSFGGEVFYRQYFTGNACSKTVDPSIGGFNGNDCINTMAQAGTNQLFGASGVLVAPGTQAQYMDEIISGFEYEVMDDLKIGASFQNRRLGRVIEDVSTDGANTYMIANPGEWSSAEEQKLEQKIMATDDPVLKGHLQGQLKMFQGIRMFDKPRRDYNALQFTITRRFSKALYVQGSYTYSRTLGNYPGLVSYDNGQLDPNISSQYDLIELLSNHIGPLRTDRPHYIKIDGYYNWDLHKAGQLTTGIRYRALSGIPTNALAAHYLYGPNESFLLPRGQLGRTEFDHGLDLHIGYRRHLTKGIDMEVFADIYNVYNRQGTFEIDETYAPSVTLDGIAQNANPVSGGTYEDLIWVKQINNSGQESSAPIGRNPNFRNTTSRYGPAYGRLGARLTF